jgi:hypothetical protein
MDRSASDDRYFNPERRSAMKAKTNVKAGGGFGLLSIDLDIEVDLDVSIGGCNGGHHKKRRC